MKLFGWRKLPRAALFVTATVLATPMMASGEAAAASGYDRCPVGAECLFSQYDGGGTIAYFRFGAPDLNDFGVGDHVYSVWNRSSDWFCNYSDYNYRSPIWDEGGGNRGDVGTPYDFTDTFLLSTKIGKCPWPTS